MIDQIPSSEEERREYVVQRTRRRDASSRRLPAPGNGPRDTEWWIRALIGPRLDSIAGELAESSSIGKSV